MLMLSSSKSSGGLQVHLVRHGVHWEFGRVLSGRAGAATLVEEGRQQARRAASWIGSESPAAIYASPRARTRETAAIIAEATGLAFTIAPSLDEIDFGQWNGLAFAELEGDAAWGHWNSERSVARAPDGETMAEAIGRVVEWFNARRRQRDSGTIVCVTHCDIIRGVIAHYLGLSLDHILRFDVDPGSVSTIQWRDGSLIVVRVNEVPV